jgi:hypothetical protein
MNLTSVHWIFCSLTIYASSILNTVTLIKFINTCQKCSDDAYIHSKAIKDAKIVEYVSLAIGLVVMLYQFASKFSAWSVTGFKSRNNTRNFDDISLYSLYFSIAYSVLTFMMLAVVKRKCVTDACHKYNDTLMNWFKRAKLVFSLMVCTLLSYLLFWKQCPKQRWGVPGESKCMRLMCENNVTDDKSLRKFKRGLEKAKDKFPNDESRQIRYARLRDEAGNVIGGDEPARFADTRDQILNCAGAERSNAELMGFRGKSWGIRCSSSIFQKAKEREKKGDYLGSSRYGRSNKYGYGRSDKYGYGSLSDSSSDRKRRRDRDRRKRRDLRRALGI